MDLSKAIAELEQQAAKYTQAADVLRALQGDSSNAVKAVPVLAAPTRRGRPAGTPNKKAAKVSATKGAGAGKPVKRTMSPETRAKIAAATKARHAARKAAA